MNQTTFVEPLKRKRRKFTHAAKIAENIGRLAEWYRANKPDVKSITITADDAYSIRKLWATKDAKTHGERECRASGFSVNDAGEIHWRGFMLTSAES